MTNIPELRTVETFIGHVGRSVFQSDLGYSTQLITRAIADNRLPARWFLDVRNWCHSKGHEVPERLFKWDRKNPADKKHNVDRHADIQEPGMENLTLNTGWTFSLTPMQHAVILGVSGGDWVSLIPPHSRGPVSRVFSYGMIRCDYETVLYPDRLWKITPRGEEYLKEVTQ